MTANAGSADRIEKRIVLSAPRDRVWHALSDAAEFGSWFGVDLTDASFVPGATVCGRLTVPGYEHLTMEIVIDGIEAGRRLSFRWHPYAVDPKQDYAAEPMTLVAFELRDVPDGTQLTVVESGFERIPLHRRAEAFRMNDQGWSMQTENIDAFLSRRA
jgi:uncharacterized protein YndB with AHSA1/START domain